MGEVHRVEIQPTITGPDAPVKGERPPSSPQGQPQDKPQGNSQGQSAGERPAYVPEKFWKDGKVDVEGLSKSYAELEKSRGSQQPPKNDLTVPEKKPNGEQTPKAEGDASKQGEQPPTEQVVIPGLKQEQTTKYWTELTQGGKLSEDSYGELAKAGYPKNVVDAYIRGIQAEQAQGQTEAAELKKLAGGEDGYAAMSEWMVANLDAAELQEYNETVSSGKKAAIKFAVQSMHARYKEAVGAEPNLLSGRGNEPARGDVFHNQREVTDAMKDPRYKKSEAYRREVAEKIQRSRLRK